MDSFADPKARGIFLREGQRLRGKFDRHQIRVRKMRGEGENNHAASGPDIEQARSLRPGKVAKVFHQLLGFGPGNESALVGQENLFAELDRPEEVLQRFTLGPSPDEFAKRRELGFGEGTFKLEVKLNPLLA